MAERSHHQNPNYPLSGINQPDMKEAPDKRTIRGFSLCQGVRREPMPNCEQTSGCLHSFPKRRRPDKVPQIED